MTLGAGIISIGLHGFLLSQWPGPFVQTPRWTGTEPITVVYLAPEESSLRGVPLSGTGSISPAGKSALPLSLARPPNLVSRSETWGDTMPARPARVPLRGTPLANPHDKTLPNPSTIAQTASLGPSSPSPWGDPSDARSVPTWLTPEAMATFRYRQTVRARLQRAIRYPAALGTSARGTVRLLVTIGRDGALQAATCAEASAPAFEEAAMEGTGGAGPFPPIPQDVPDAPLVCEFLVAFVPGADTTINTLDGSRSPQ